MDTESLLFVPAIDRPDLLSQSTLNFLKNWRGSIPVQEFEVAQIDPIYAGGNDLCRHYRIPKEEGANCVIVEAIRGNTSTIAACVAPVNHRIDFNGVVRKALNARRVSLALLDYVLKATEMEYGSITPVGLPTGWPILLDSRVLIPSHNIIGSGRLHAKLRLPTKVFAELHGVQVVENLAIPLK